MITKVYTNRWEGVEGVEWLSIRFEHNDQDYVVSVCKNNLRSHCRITKEVVDFVKNYPNSKAAYMLEYGASVCDKLDYFHNSSRKCFSFGSDPAFRKSKSKNKAFWRMVEKKMVVGRDSYYSCV